MGEQTFIVQNQKNNRLSCVLHTPLKKTKKIVILCHGLRAQKLTPWIFDTAVALTSIGYAVCRFDFSGHGCSEGKFENTSYAEWCDDLLAVIDWLGKKGFNEFCLIGHSMAGGVVLLIAEKDKRVKTLGIIAGVMHPENHVPYLEHLRLKYNLQKLSLMLSKLDLIGCARKIHMPTFVIHGTKDTRVPIAESKELFLALHGRRTLFTILGADHGFLDSHSTELVRALVRFVKHYF